MTRTPRTLAVVDAGGATTSVSLLVRLADRWRFVATIAGPAGTPESALLAVVADRARAADTELATWPDLRPEALATIPILAARSRHPQTLLVIGASRRSVGDMEAQARRTPWRIVGASTESHDPREMMALALDPSTDAVLIGTGDPPGPDERAALDDLAALGGAIARRRPDLRLIVGAPLQARRAWSESLGEEPGDPDRITVAPAASSKGIGSDALRDVLSRLLVDPENGRDALGAVAVTLAEILGLRVEILDIGFDGGARMVAEPGAPGSGPSGRGVVSAAAGLVPAEPDDTTVDEVLAWSTGSLDRHRMSDRLRDLRRRPWVDGTGDGARLRLAAGMAALTRLAALTPELGGGPPADLTVICGGAFAGAPASAVALAVADTIRRNGTTQLARDHARLLGPIGTIEDDGERRSLLTDLIEDALVPLGSLLVAGGIRGPRPAARRTDGRHGRLRLEVGGVVSNHDLAAGDLTFVHLPAGVAGAATIEFPEVVRLGKRTRNVTAPVSGGLAGLMIDLRDVPLSLPDRRDRRRSRLAEWGARAWPKDDR